MVNNNIESVADIGGRKLLGMGGSLMGYINTGNQYDTRYYKVDNFDSFINEEKKNITQKENISKVSILIGALALSAASVFSLIKGKKGVAEKYFSNLDKNIFTNVRKNCSSCLDRIKNSNFIKRFAKK